MAKQVRIHQLADLAHEESPKLIARLIEQYSERQHIK